jgi:hypothetical protein
MTNDQRQTLQKPNFSINYGATGRLVRLGFAVSPGSRSFMVQGTGLLTRIPQTFPYQIGVGVVVCVTSAGFLLGNLFLANQFKYSDTSLILDLHRRNPGSVASALPG